MPKHKLSQFLLPPLLLDPAIIEAKWLNSITRLAATPPEPKYFPQARPSGIVSVIVSQNRQSHQKHKNDNDEPSCESITEMLA